MKITPHDQELLLRWRPINSNTIKLLFKLKKRRHSFIMLGLVGSGKFCCCSCFNELERGINFLQLNLPILSAEFDESLFFWMYILCAQSPQSRYRISPSFQNVYTCPLEVNPCPHRLAPDDHWATFYLYSSAFSRISYQ